MKSSKTTEPTTPGETRNLTSFERPNDSIAFNNSTPPKNSELDELMAMVNDVQRLLELDRTQLLDSPPEAAFDRLTTLASKILRAPVSLISLVDGERQFFKSQHGLTGPWAQARQTPLSHSFCKHVVASGQPLIISDARLNPILKNNKAVSDLGVIAYAGIPLETSSGQPLGSFCTIDDKPREWTAQEIEILQDLAAAVMTEIELRLVARELAENFQKLQKLESLRADLTHMIVHDLRGPLTSILSGLQLLPEVGELNAEQTQMLELSRNSGGVLLELINDMLDISKMESGAIRLRHQEINVAQAVAQAWQQVEPQAVAKQQEYSCCIASDLPTISADAGLLSRVLVNLLCNAVKYTPTYGKIVASAWLQTDNKSIENEQNGSKQNVGDSPRRSMMCIAISDSGLGIATENFERIFEKFGQVETPQYDRLSTGLGLTFCKMVIEAHGGKIWVESEFGEGSKFIIALPFDIRGELVATN